ncbi:MAG TPA: hypothetical protein PK544_13275, partial [Spirochaetota bacterium]|nr:hypothetical protein [Spirochaetota bacterium]
IFNLPGGERDAINPGEIIEEFVSSRNESEKRFLLLENINSALQATGDQNYLRRIIDVLFYGFDWINHQDSRLKISFGDNDSTGATIAFCFDNADFSHLAETNFYLPFSEKRYFNTGIELFEVFFLSYLSGWELTFSSTIDYRFLLYLK